MTAEHPAGTTTRLEEAQRQLIDLLGREAVLTNEGQVAEFHDPYEGANATEYQPSFVVQPADVAGVQAVVRVAADLGVPVWTSSQGRNYGYGGSAPIVNGSIVLNLRRLNRVLEIDERGAWALVEPGVTFADLYAEIKRRNLKLWISVPDLGWGSVVGNALEHGQGYTVYGDHSTAVAGLEVVLADGDILRTGQGAFPDSEAGYRYKRAFGPSVDALFMQSNFGVVTKMAIWLMPEPEVFTTGTVNADRDEDIVALIDALAPLVLDGTIQGQPLIVGAAEPADGRVLPGEDTSSASKARKLSAAFPGPRWAARIGFYGDTAIVEARVAAVRRAIADLDGITVDLRTYPGNATADLVHPADLVPAGIPNQFLLEQLKAQFGDRIGHVDFSPVIPFTGEAAARHERLVREVLDAEGLVAGFAWIAGPRALTGACMVLFDSDDDQEREAAFRAVTTLVERARKLGWAEYRSHPRLVEDVAATFDFGDRALRRFYGRIKDALDPAGILSPGNHGIWPGAAPAVAEE